MKKIRTVLIPAAGQGTRLLPATKATPKELLAVYDRPVLQFALDEAIAARVERVVIVTHPSKAAIRSYIESEYPCTDRSSGKHGLADVLSDLKFSPSMEVVFVNQSQPLGLGHAILCCRDLVLPGPIAVILPDDIIMGESCLAEMTEAYAGGHMIAAMEVGEAETQCYGIFSLKNSGHGRSVPVSGMVEKPPVGQAPSRLAAVGRYILDPVIFPTLAATRPGAGNELQLTDAIAHDAGSVTLTAFRFSGRRFDCGSHDGLMEAGLARQAVVKNRRDQDAGNGSGPVRFKAMYPRPMPGEPIASPCVIP